MKNYFPVLLALLAGNLAAQTATSVSNGNWTSPFTWSCTCVPTPGYTVVINTNVTLNTSFAYTSGSITINAGASLVEDTPSRDIWVNGGSLINNGTLDVRYLWTQSGTFSNSGTLTARSVLSNVNFTNTGTFQNVDSMYTTATVTNNGSFLNIDSVTNGGSFTNNGILQYNQFTNQGTLINNNNLTFTDITNNGSLTNNDTITALNSGWNPGSWTMNAGSYFLAGNSFLNQDPLQHDAVFDNDGAVRIMDSWYNMDTMKGGSTGSFIVTDTSYNSGWMKESFDFCDLSPPSSAPYIDFNLGSVSSGISWCLSTGMEIPGETAIAIYPNPCSEALFVYPGISSGKKIVLTDLTGRLVLSAENTERVDVSGLPPGLYLLTVETAGKTITQKITIARL